MAGPRVAGNRHSQRIPSVAAPTVIAALLATARRRPELSQAGWENIELLNIELVILIPFMASTETSETEH